MGNQFPQPTAAKIDDSQPLRYSKARQIFCVQSRRLAPRSPPPLRRPPATVHAQRRLIFPALLATVGTVVTGTVVHNSKLTSRCLKTKSYVLSRFKVSQHVAVK
ncbi:hypothetical protein T07_4065 [Trichinella nelsoni]|uniref:Uncharacterized protein n=1 Tax=Trichinella nelsoni TaxID=6336 RepID=A0A0V0SAD2_9BILA|nr:hypothetical protein T07_4065 [Trichinella nelsoni]